MSTTIHLTIDDPTEALAALAAIVNLNIEFEMNIDLDDSEPVTNTSAPAESLVDEIIAYEADRRALAAHTRRQRQFEDEHDYDAIITTTECPKCLATYAMPCEAPSGPHSRPYVHMGRRTMWRRDNQRPAVPVRTANQIIDRIILDEV